MLKKKFFGFGYGYGSGVNASKIGVSENGSDWALLMDNTDNSIQSIVWGNNVYVAVGNDKILWSENLAGWTPATATAYTGASSNFEYYTIAYGNGKFAAGGYSGHLGYSSSDGKIWYPVSTSNPSPLGNSSI